MKIDIHVHTKKVKSGDAETRNVSAKKFGEIIKNTDVKIIAVTNHNHFDINQYEEFVKEVGTDCQIWPGVELDVYENGKRAHLIVIVNPENYNLFNDKVINLISGESPDNFKTSISNVVETFDKLDCIYIAHYFAKKPDLGEKEIELLKTLVSNPKRIIKEATNSFSAGIYISHGHNSLYGSDVHDWNDYIRISKELPELRLPVGSFKQFCLLLDKNEAMIDTLLNQKVKQSLELTPFGIAELIKIDVYEDINIIFGSKGTGKTIILDAISNYYNSLGHKTNVFKSNDKHLDVVFDLKGNLLSVDLSDLNIDSCYDEIEFLKDITEEEVTSLTKYLLHYSRQETNKLSQKLKIRNISKIDENQLERKLDEVSKILSQFDDFFKFVEGNGKLKDYIGDSLLNELTDILNKIAKKLKSQIEDKFIDLRSICLLNRLIEIFHNEISRKTGIPMKPTKTGFVEYARNRINIQVATRKVLFNLNIEVKPIKKYIGSLGLKGELFCQTNLKMQNGSLTNSNYNPIRRGHKSPLKDFANHLNSINNHIHSNLLFEKISLFSENSINHSIIDLNNLLLFYRHFVVNDKLYNPSQGESSMILLHMELLEDKDIYLIDEPEKSLGNDYINDVIVPLLKEKALMGKKIILATHDANIAVRTLPYNSIYRLHSDNQYFTFSGNPFSNKLKCLNSNKSDLVWKEISMKTLEGGREAFGERGKIYGN